MQRKAFVMKIKPGVREEYKRRHDNIWPEMRQMLTEAGLHNYTIWMYGEDTLFGYYETEDDEYAVKIQEGSEVAKRWEAYMSDFLATKVMPDGSVMPIKDELELMFLHE